MPAGGGIISFLSVLHLCFEEYQTMLLVSSGFIRAVCAADLHNTLKTASWASNWSGGSNLMALRKACRTPHETWKSVQKE